MTKDDETKQNLIKMINSTLNNLYDNNTETFEENNVIDNLIDQLILAINHMEDNKGYVQIEDFDFDSFKAFYRESIKNIKKIIQIKTKIIEGYIPKYFDIGYIVSIEKFTKKFISKKLFNENPFVKYVYNLLIEYHILTSPKIEQFQNELEYFLDFFIYLNQTVNSENKKFYKKTNSFVGFNYDEVLKIERKITKIKSDLEKETDRNKKVKYETRIGIILEKTLQINYLACLFDEINFEEIIPYNEDGLFVIYLNILYNIINGKVLKDVIYDRIIQELELTDEGFKDRFTNAEIFFYKLAFNELRPPYIDVEISISDETRLTILGILREGVIHVFTLPSYTINHMYFFDSGVKKFKIENDLSKNRIEKITVITKSGSFVVYDEKRNQCCCCWS